MLQYKQVSLHRLNGLKMVKSTLLKHNRRGRILKRRIKLQVLISVLILFVIVSTVAIDGLISMNSYKQTLSENHLEGNYNYVQKLQSTTTHQLNYMYRNIGAMGNDMGKHEYDQNDLDEWYHANRGHFSSLFIMDPEGEVELISPSKVVLRDESIIEKGTRLEGSLIENALKKRKPYISQPDYSLGNELITLISAPIFDDETGVFQGMIVGAIHMESSNVLKCILGNHNYEDKSYVYVVNESGQLIYHPDEERIGEDVSSNEVVKKVIQGESGSEEVINSRSIEFFASYTYLDVADWGIVVQTPVEIIKKPLQDLFWRIITLTVPFLIIILIISSLIVSMITKPLNRLANFSEKTIEGEGTVQDVKELQLETRVHEVHVLYNQVVSHFTMLNEQATVDGLTKIFNRHKFNIVIERVFSEKTPFSLIMLDIDFFKKVNDTYGHVVGDEVLYYLAQEIDQFIGEEHQCFRYGGEEFAIVLENVRAKEAFAMAEHLRELIAGQKSPTGEPIYISLGVAERTDDETSALKLIEKADVALYESKQTGRNKTTLYTEDLLGK